MIVIKDKNNIITETVVKYYCKKISKGIVIRYYDVETKNLLSEETYPGLESDYYKVEPKIIEGYEIITDNLPTNA